MNLSFIFMVFLLGITGPLGMRAQSTFGIQSSPPTAPPAPPTQPQPSDPNPSKPDEDPEKIKVWVTASGKKYHKSNCRYARGASPITLKEARTKGLDACKICGGH